MQKIKESYFYLGVGALLVVFTVLFFIKQQYSQSLLCLVLLMVLLKFDDLKTLAIKKDGLSAEFYRDEYSRVKKTEKDIKENGQQVNERTYIDFRAIEDMVLSKLQQRYKEKLKSRVHFVYGDPAEFAYSPDASVQTEEAITLFEVKYVSRPDLAPQIINKTLKYLESVWQKLSPSAGKKLILRLVLASPSDIDLSSYELPDGIELEYFKL